MRNPPLRYYLESILRDRGGVSRTGPLSPAHQCLGGIPLAECRPLKFTLTSFNKEVKPFSLSDKSIWWFPSVSLPLAIAAFGGPLKAFLFFFGLAIIAFGAFGFIVPIY